MTMQEMTRRTPCPKNGIAPGVEDTACRMGREKPARDTCSAGDLRGWEDLSAHLHRYLFRASLRTGGSESGGSREYHEDEPDLAVEETPCRNGTCETFQRTVLAGFSRVAFRTTVYGSVEELQRDVDEWRRDSITSGTAPGSTVPKGPPWRRFWTPHP